MNPFSSGANGMLNKTTICFFIALLFTVLPLRAMASSTEVTIYVDNNYYPFSFSKNKQATGMYINVLKAAFSKMKEFHVSIVPIPWKRGKKIMANGEGFALAPAFFHAHDWGYLYPYSLPFYTETIIAACNKSVMSQPRPNWPNDYKGLSIGNVSGFDGWGGLKFRQLVENGDINYSEIKSSKSLIKMLVDQKYDCIMIEDRVFDYTLKQEKKQGNLMKSTIIGKDPVYIGYSEKFIQNGRQAKEYEFRKLFDSTIYKMKKSGEIDNILNSYH